MKRKPQHFDEPKGARSWFRSYSDLQTTASERDDWESEFPKDAAEMRDENDSEVSRRGFMKLMGASTALAGGMAACRRPEAHILPYSKAIEWIVPGKALLYATAMPRLGGCTPIIATTHEGRPTHLSGNPLHPNSNGGTDNFASSSILDLYDPDRSTVYAHNGEGTDAAAFDAAFAEIKQKHAGGKGLALLIGESTSPTRSRLLNEFKANYSAAKVYRYEAINHDELTAATETAFGPGMRQRFHFDKAKRILSIGCDFLGNDRLGDSSIAEFSTGRSQFGRDSMNRLYVLEHAFSVTGGKADHRLPVPASQLASALAAIAKAGGIDVGPAGSIDEAWAKECIDDLKAHSGAALVVASPRLPAAVHAMVALVNQSLGAFGKTISVHKSEAVEAGTLGDLAKAAGAGEIDSLIITTEADPVYDAPADLKIGEVFGKIANVVHIGVRNLCATARAANWQVPGTHFLESWGDVRASDGSYSIVQPMIEPLYSGRSELDILLDLLSDPPAEGESAAPAPAVPSADPAMLAVKKTFESLAGGDAAVAWSQCLRDGFLPGSAYESVAAAPNLDASTALAGSLKSPSAPTADAFELVMPADSKVYDGRYINNAWQQEAPDPVSKITWDNAAMVSPRTAHALGVFKPDPNYAAREDYQIEDEVKLVRVTANGVSAVFPVLAIPGHSDNSVTIPLGYGQSAAGRVSEGFSFDGADFDTEPGTGFNVNPMRTSADGYIATGVRVELVEEKVEVRPGGKKRKTYALALTQEHNYMEDRAIVRDGTVEEAEHALAHAGDGHRSVFQTRGMDAHAPLVIPGYHSSEFDYTKGPQWGMSIDLNTCIGCNACLLSCQSENNIPVVGKEQVIKGREMHWIRMDRYFAPDRVKDDHGHMHVSEDADLSNPQMIVQPMACQQCEAAPCETVCPVNATVHEEQGLNLMVYNRCIGTRYCANNCPYKARRFNFFDYNKRPLDELYWGPLSTPEKTGTPEAYKLQKNPNVTVRMRGVMEKCTYCIQRIREASIKQKRTARDTDNLKLPTDSVKSACQQACPADAIQFGDIIDVESSIAKTRNDPRNYFALEYIGARPRTSYLAAIKNPNPAMPGAEQIGTVSKHIH